MDVWLDVSVMHLSVLPLDKSILKHVDMWTCLHHRSRSCTWTCLHCRDLCFIETCLNHRGLTKGVGPGATLAWPGWKQPDISVKMDTARLETGQSKKCCIECVYCTPLELNSRVLLLYTDMAWCRSCRVILYRTVHLGVSFFEGGCRQGWTSIWYCVNGTPQKDTGKPAYICMLSYSIDVFHLSFNFLCWCYSSVSISVGLSFTWTWLHNRSLCCSWAAIQRRGFHHCCQIPPWLLGQSSQNIRPQAGHPPTPKPSEEV